LDFEALVGWQMVILNKKALAIFSLKHADARRSIATWVKATEEANWRTKQDVFTTFANAKFVANNRARFEIVHNKYRLIAEVLYDDGVVQVRFIGTHNEYDKIDPSTI
jgi:mRNA interferase HigB